MNSNARLSMRFIYEHNIAFLIRYGDTHYHHKLHKYIYEKRMKLFYDKYGKTNDSSCLHEMMKYRLAKSERELEIALKDQKIGSYFFMMSSLFLSLSWIYEWFLK